LIRWLFDSLAYRLSPWPQRLARLARHAQAVLLDSGVAATVDGYRVMDAKHAFSESLLFVVRHESDLRITPDELRRIIVDGLNERLGTSLRPTHMIVAMEGVGGAKQAELRRPAVPVAGMARGAASVAAAAVAGAAAATAAADAVDFDEPGPPLDSAFNVEVAEYSEDDWRYFRSTEMGAAQDEPR